MVFRLGRWLKNFRRDIFAGGSKIENLVEKHNPYHIFGSKGAFNRKLSEKIKFNKKSGIVGSFLNFCWCQNNKFLSLKYPIVTWQGQRRYKIHLSSAISLVEFFYLKLYHTKLIKTMKCIYVYVLCLCFINGPIIEFQGPEWFRLS